MERRADARIALVDDYAPLCRLYTQTLLQAGYRYAEGFETARAAVRHFAIYPIDLCIIDVTLGLGDLYPNGCAFARAVLDRWPNVRLLFMSGYSIYDEQILSICPPDILLMQKPTHPQVFLARVAETLMADPYRWPER